MSSRPAPVSVGREGERGGVIVVQTDVHGGRRNQFGALPLCTRLTDRDECSRRDHCSKSINSPAVDPSRLGGGVLVLGSQEKEEENVLSSPPEDTDSTGPWHGGDLSLWSQKRTGTPDFAFSATPCFSSGFKRCAICYKTILRGLIRLVKCLSLKNITRDTVRVTATLEYVNTEVVAIIAKVNSCRVI